MFSQTWCLCIERKGWKIFESIWLIRTLSEPRIMFQLIDWIFWTSKKKKNSTSLFSFSFVFVLCDQIWEEKRRQEGFQSGSVQTEVRDAEWPRVWEDEGGEREVRDLEPSSSSSVTNTSCSSTHLFTHLQWASADRSKVRGCRPLF